MTNPHKSIRIPGQVLGYLIIVVAAIYVIGLIHDSQTEINAQALEAKNLASESQRQANIVAANQKTGEDFVLKQCVSNRLLLEVQADDKETASKADRTASKQFLAYGQSEMAKIVAKRSDREHEVAEMFRGLMPEHCGYIFRDTKTGKPMKRVAP